MNQSINLRSITFLSVALIMLLGYNFLSAQVWTPAPGTPPASNTPAPINVGPTMQAKTGNLAANIFAATTEMRSNRYCDALGGNCVATTGLGGSDAIGVGQVWTDVKSSRAKGTVYTNTSGRPIMVAIDPGNQNNYYAIEVSSDGLSWVRLMTKENGDGGSEGYSFVVPDGWRYRLEGDARTYINNWAELR